jgi:hypothetical protein
VKQENQQNEENYEQRLPLISKVWMMMLMFVLFITGLMLLGISTVFGFLSTLHCSFYDNTKLFRDSPVVTRNRAVAEKNKAGRVRQTEGHERENMVANQKKWIKHEHAEKELHDILMKEAKMESTLPIIEKERERKEFLDSLKDKVIQQTIKESIVVLDAPLNPSSSSSVAIPVVKAVHIDLARKKKKQKRTIET